jgi:uncharacterized protein YndB with AHSA1/START domain
MPGDSLEMTKVPEVKVGMLIRRPVSDVFRALIDPLITTKFWYTKSSGVMEPGAQLTWTWEMYDASAAVVVKEFDENNRVVFEWPSYDNKVTTVEFRFLPWENDTTYLQIFERDFTGSGDQLVAYVTDSTQGFTFLLSSLKAFLEHDVVLTVVLDHAPKGLEV